MPESSCLGFVLSPSGGPLPINLWLVFLLSPCLVFVTQLPFANVVLGGGGDRALLGVEGRL